jgi:hypothetical protein
MKSMLRGEPGTRGVDCGHTEGLKTKCLMTIDELAKEAMRLAL